MKILDPGHTYELHQLDFSDYSVWNRRQVILQFVKREGEKYPGNVGHYPGTTIQDVLRCCIDRLSYVNAQDHHISNIFTMVDLKSAIYNLETRAAMRHGIDNWSLNLEEIKAIDILPFNPKNGHLILGAGR